ncbi:MAG: DUF5752 family protein [Candidatus Sulfotelmatobacter sp.]
MRKDRNNEIQNLQARAPFHFNSAAHLLRIGEQRAANLSEFREALHCCPEESIFQHTFRTLQEHHFIRQGFSNDFAHWAYADCNEAGLGERLAGVDIRSFTSIADLRQQLMQIVDDYVQSHPQAAGRAARKPFHFCASDTVVMPTALVARSLAEFAAGLAGVTIHSIHHHFIEARLRLKLQSNDFSLWLDEDLGLAELGARINRIDIYTSTLEGVRQQILRIVKSTTQ